jgi:hypothetical protein
MIISGGIRHRRRHLRERQGWIRIYIILLICYCIYIFCSHVRSSSHVHAYTCSCSASKSAPVPVLVRVPHIDSPGPIYIYNVWCHTTGHEMLLHVTHTIERILMSLAWVSRSREKSIHVNIYHQNATNMRTPDHNDANRCTAASPGRSKQSAVSSEQPEPATEPQQPVATEAARARRKKDRNKVVSWITTSKWLNCVMCRPNARRKNTLVLIQRTPQNGTTKDRTW